MTSTWWRSGFPRVGVLQEGGWNCHQFHGQGEFFADFGSFDVSITVPTGYVVGATGMLQGPPRIADGLTTWRYAQDEVHDFAWTADPDYVKEVRWFRYAEQRDADEEARVAAALGIPADDPGLTLTDVEVTVLLQPEHRALMDRHFAAAFAALNTSVTGTAATHTRRSRWLTRPSGARCRRDGVPDPDHGRLQLLAPAQPAFPRVGHVHEFGHQYWYGMVANNEAEEAFLDEGFNSYSEGLILDKIYGPNRDAVELAPGVSWLGVPFVDIPLRPDPEETAPRLSLSDRVVDFLLMRPFGPSDDLTLNAFRDLPFLNYANDAPIDEVTSERRRYLVAPQADSLARRSWEYATRDSYGLNSYARTALMLRTLEGILGRDRMLRVMRTYHQRYRFRHPTVRDFISTAEEVAGEPLDAFFAQTVFGSDLLDYAADKIPRVFPRRGVDSSGRTARAAR